jgi:hypothetical protein
MKEVHAGIRLVEPLGHRRIVLPVARHVGVFEQHLNVFFG